MAGGVPGRRPAFGIAPARRVLFGGEIMAVFWPSVLARRSCRDPVPRRALEPRRGQRARGERSSPILLAAITIISFTQVVARYGFNTGWGGALELTRILFAWLILFGMSYGVKQGMHLGVDALIRILPETALSAPPPSSARCAACSTR
jgi:hypothetical protein